MKFYITIIILALLTACHSNSTSSCSKDEAPYFIQISDPQLGFINKSEDITPEKELMTRIISQVNRLNPEFVVFSGDLVHWRTDTNALNAFDSLCKMIRKDIPVYYLPGNHDVGNEAEPQEIEKFTNRYGATRFVHQSPQYTVIGFNSCPIKAQTPAQEEEYNWLDEQLGKLSAQNYSKPIILVAHHPIFATSADEAESYENLPFGPRQKYLNLFEKHGVDLSLAGHLHKCAQGEYNGIKFATFSAAGRQLGKELSGYAIVKIEDGQAQYKYVTAAKYQPEEYQKGEFVSEITGDTLLYRYLTPQKKAKKYPIVVFLHGSGERGNDNQAQLFHGSGQFLNPVNREKFPAYVLFPQGSPEKFGVFDKPFESEEPQDMPVNPPLSSTMQTLKELIEHYASLPDADPDRIYIMGISMGGMGTYEMVARYPEMFAAAIPICGSVNPERLMQNSVGVKKVKFRIFHGDADIAVPVEGSRQAYRALKEIGAKVEYFELPGCTHNSWNPAFNRPDFLEWLFEQKR